MHALLPELRPDPDVHEHYALDWTDSGGVRANMIASADGASDAGGLSRGLQTPGDTRIFTALRDLADVVLVGAATADAEGYRPAQFGPDRTSVRRRFGLRPELPIALVTRTLLVDPDGPLFADPRRRPLVVTTAAADPSPLEGRAELIVCGEQRIDFGRMRRELAVRGLTRVLCEGGPRLLGELLAAGEVDELCLTVSPLMVGPGAPRIVAGQPWPSVPARLEPTGLLTEDGALFVRYAVARAEGR